MRILFAGSPEIALPSLERVAAEHQIVGVLTNPEAPKGRGLCHACTPVAELAARLLPGVPVLSPARLGPQLRQTVQDLQPELLVVFAYGRIFGPKFLALFPRGSVNVHPSLLPRWRGCSPVPHAIMHQDARTGVTVQRIALQMDTGDILAAQEIDLDGSETTESLSKTAAAVGAALLADVLRQLAAGTEQPRAQNDADASYCVALSKELAAIDWSTDAAAIDARIRAFNPWPVAWTLLNGQRLAIHRSCRCPDLADSGQAPGTIIRIDKSRGIMVQTGNGILALQALQLPGKKLLPYKDFVNGVRNLESARLCSGQTRQEHE